MKKKNILIVVIVSFFAIFFISATLFFTIKNIRIDDRINGYFEPYKNLAIDYIKNNEELKSLYGDDIDIDYERLSYKYSSKEYVNFIFYRKDPKNAQEFEKSIEYIRFNFEINYDKDYIVEFTKDEDGELFISDFYLEN